MKSGLLPTGLGDLLPPDAEQEAQAVYSLMDGFGRFGYQRVKPPLAEFEDSLSVHGPQQGFRLMDAASERMLAMRTDITPQIGRIAATRLATAARPLRLSYTGEILKIRGTQLRPERQYRQAGCEIIGALDPAADTEVIAVATHCLLQLGVKDLTIDLCLPTLIPNICKAFGVDEKMTTRLCEVVDRRDAAALKTLATDATDTILSLMETSGRAEQTLTRLEKQKLPEATRGDIVRLKTVVDRLADKLDPSVSLTIDPLEQRGFEFQTGLSFTFLTRHCKAALGRGGRYRTQNDEPATGFTFYLPSLLQVLPDAEKSQCIFVPAGTDWSTIQALQNEGWRTVLGLNDKDDPKNLDCSHIWKNNSTEEI